MGVKRDLENIMDCFSGADGGIKFARAKFALEEFEAQAKDGDKSSEILLEIVGRFSRLLDVLNQR